MAIKNHKHACTKNCFRLAALAGEWLAMNIRIVVETLQLNPGCERMAGPKGPTRTRVDL